METQFKGKAIISMIILMGTLTFCGLAQNSKVPTMVKKFEMKQKGTLNTKSSGGGMTVLSHDLSEVEVQVFVRKNGNILSPEDSGVKEVLEAFDLDISKNGSVINAIAERKANLKMRNVGIFFTIIVPKEMSCNVTSSGGGVKVSGVTGTHDLLSSGGSVHIENTSGNTKAKSSGGKVQATNHSGDMHLVASGGGVNLTEAHGSVYAHSSGGSVKLKSVHGPVDASSSGGSVSVSGECESVIAKSSGGSVHVNISNLSKELHLKSSGGKVDASVKGGAKLGLDLDLSASGGNVNVDLSNFNGQAKKNKVTGKISEGGIPVYMHSSGGSASLRFE